MPTKSQIAAYSCDSHYDNTEAKSLLAFLDKIISEDAPRREDLDFEIPYSCEQNWSPHEVAELLIQYGFPFEDSEAVSTFTRLYNALRKNTRQWALRGKTPWQHAQDSGTSYPRFHLPSIKPRSVKTVGRICSISPNKSELGKYEMMEEFCEGFADGHIRDCLSIAIDGSGAFRRFKNTVNRFGVEDQWYAYKDQAMLEFARKWCEENNIPY